MENSTNEIQIPIERFIPGNDTLFKSRHKTIEITEEEYNEIQAEQNITIVEDVVEDSKETEDNISEDNEEE